jgi:predicted acylesterase/phospholipase RssA
LVIPVTDVDALKTVTLRDFPSGQDLKSALRASAWLPIAVPGTMTMDDGRRVIDGGVLTALPFRLALNDGCTHVLSLSTRPMRPAGSGLSLMHRYTYLYLERMRRGLGKGYLDAIRQKHRDQAWLHTIRLTPEDAAPHVLDLAPLPWMKELKRHELDHHEIFESARVAYEISFCATEGKSAGMIRSGSIRAMPRLTMVDTANGQRGRDARITPDVAARAEGV